MSSDVDLSIIMLAKNEAHHLRGSLPLLLAQETNCPYELIVIDSGSKDGTRELVAEWARRQENVRLVVIDPADFHHARTRNFGASLARGRYLVFLGGDAVPRDTQWLSELAAPVMAGREERLAASYSRQIPRPEADVNNVCRMGYNYGADSRVQRDGGSLTAKQRYFFSSVSCCISRDLVELPLFDESFPVNEDWTLARRLIGQGLQIAYCADSVVIHSHNYGYLDMLRRSFDNGVVAAKLRLLAPGDRSARVEAGNYLRYGWMALAERGSLARLQFLLFFTISGVGVKLGLWHRILPKYFCRLLSKYQTV
jgi:glycosyltransferase involved in cell wall biosynthesis